MSRKSSPLPRTWIVPALLGVLAGGLGCFSPSTRLPTCATRPASVESRSWNLNDPFPDEDMGPTTFTRPRSFIQPRTETYVDRELQFYMAAHGLPNRALAGGQRLPQPAVASGPYAQPPVAAWNSPAGVRPVAIPPTSAGPVAAGSVAPVVNGRPIPATAVAPVWNWPRQ